MTHQPQSQNGTLAIEQKFSKDQKIFHSTIQLPAQKERNYLNISEFTWIFEKLKAPNKLNQVEHKQRSIVC